MYIEQIDSTNTYLKQHPEEDEVYTSYQTAGRGQAGNSWESEKGKNLLLSIRLHPHRIEVANQWKICMQVSVALWQVVAEYITDRKMLTIKWPNDLYYEDKKLAGVLIEHQLTGNYIAESIVGIGLNVNQTQWTDSVPNPTSIKAITGKDTSIEELAQTLGKNLLNIGITSANWESLYMQYLYRREGVYWWEERVVNSLPTMNGNRTDSSFEAEILGITSQGELVLQRRNGEEKKYHFKQIKYIL